MRYIVPLIALVAIMFTGCTTSSKTEDSSPSSSILGEWELSKEIVNNKTLDCSAEEIKTILSFEKEAYFVYFDDLSNSGLGSKIAKIQTHYKGQYVVDGDKLTLTYTDDSEDFTDEYSIKSNTENDLVLVNKKSAKESHYIKR